MSANKFWIMSGSIFGFLGHIKSFDKIVEIAGEIE
jgi:hypothetical protein